MKSADYFCKYSCSQAEWHNDQQINRTDCMTSWPHTSLTNFIIQQSLSFKGLCVPLCLTNCLFSRPASQPAATEHFQSPLYGSGTVFRSISHLLHHYPFSSLAWRHTSSNSLTRNCCRACEVTMSFTDMLIALTYLLLGNREPAKTPL